MGARHKSDSASDPLDFNVPAVCGCASGAAAAMPMARPADFATERSASGEFGGSRASPFDRDGKQEKVNRSAPLSSPHPDCSANATHVAHSQAPAKAPSVPTQPVASRVDRLSDQQVIARIGQLLFEGYLLQKAESKAPTKARLPDVVSILPRRRDKHELAVLEFLGSCESATPKLLRKQVGCSRATISRVLARLVSSGAVVGAGRTKGLAYRLVRKELSVA